MEFTFNTDRTSDKWYAIYDNVDWHPERANDYKNYNEVALQNNWTVDKDVRVKEIEPYLNKWYRDNYELNKDETVIYNNWVFTIKKCDEPTKNWLHDIEINPISLNINVSFSGGFTTDKNGNKLYGMTCIIHSIDDLVYCIFFENKLYLDLIEIRKEIMSWIDTKDYINGDEFINYCISKGADADSFQTS